MGASLRVVMHNLSGVNDFAELATTPEQIDQSELGFSVER
jgi:hypothetical protein